MTSTIAPPVRPFFTPEKAELPQIHDPLFETLAILAAVLYILAAHTCMKMDPWQRNLRMMHHLNEFLDLDSAKSNVVDEFVSLFNAIREGLTHIDDDFQIPDSQINMLFLSKLKSRPEWADWATALLRDPQVNGSDSTVRISFQELARWAREEEKAIQVREEEEEEDDHDSGIELPVQPPPSTLPADRESAIDPLGWGGAAPRIQSRSRALTQDEINAFVVQKMDQEGIYRSGSTRGHRKRPSQEEINQYVVEQMHREQDRGTRARSYSQPEPRIANRHHQEQHMRHQQSARVPRCRFCSDLHPSDRCWRRWRVAVEAPQANFFPKRVEYRTEVPGQPPMYRTGFTLY